MRMVTSGRTINIAKTMISQTNCCCSLLLNLFAIIGRTSSASTRVSRKGSNWTKAWSDGSSNQLLIGMPLLTCNRKTWHGDGKTKKKQKTKWIMCRCEQDIDLISSKGEGKKLFDSLNNNFHQINESNFRQLKFEKWSTSLHWKSDYLYKSKNGATENFYWACAVLPLTDIQRD